MFARAIKSHFFCQQNIPFQRFCRRRRKPAFRPISLVQYELLIDRSIIETYRPAFVHGYFSHAETHFGFVALYAARIQPYHNVKQPGMLQRPIQRFVHKIVFHQPDLETRIFPVQRKSYFFQKFSLIKNLQFTLICFSSQSLYLTAKRKISLQNLRHFSECPYGNPGVYFECRRLFYKITF